MGQSATAVVNKHVKGYLRTLSEEIGGKYTEYTDDSVIVTLPTEDGRYQHVKGFIKPDADGVMLIFISKVCAIDEYKNINYVQLLKNNRDMCYSKFMVEDDFLEVVAKTKYDLCTFEQVRFMIFEVAKVADSMEHFITGKDKY